MMAHSGIAAAAGGYNSAEVSTLQHLRMSFAGILLAAANPAFAQAPPDSPPADVSTAKPLAAGDRFLLSPLQMLRGFTDFELAPHNNEPDLGRCLPSTGAYGGAQAPCSDFARYMLSGYLEVQPFGRTPLRRLYFFVQPRFSFGATVPKISYPNSFSPIAWENLVGAGVELSRSFDLRVVSHNVYWLGRYANTLGPADLGTTGPYGKYATVGVRWKFGSVSRAHNVP
jgi:hypothetical protein